DPNFIEPFYRTVDLGKHGSLLIRNFDNIIIAAQGFPENVIGHKVGWQARASETLATRPSSGNYWGRGLVDGVTRLIAYRTSEEFALHFAIGLAEDDILSEYRRHRTAYVLVASIVTLLVLIAIGFAIRYQIRFDNSQRDLRRLNEEISRQNVRFDAALTNMSCGLAMFDADGRLTVWNERYNGIYRMPAEMVQQGASIYSIVKYCNQTGEQN